MKRPLCYICLVYVVTVYFYLLFYPPSSAEIVEEGVNQTYCGVIYQKEIKQEQCILYLKKVQNISWQFDAKENPQNRQKDLRIICYLTEGKEPKIGSCVCIKGKNRKFREPRNYGEFDEQAYYRIQKISFALDNAIILEQSEKYDYYKEWLYSLKSFLGQQLDKSLQKEDASVLKAILLGMKRELDPSYKDIFQKSGISHILAISGLHISILGMGLFRLMKRWKIPIKARVIICVFFMFQYGEMVGMTSSAMRAILMFSLKLGSYYCKRTYDMFTTLAITAVSILIEQPLYLFHAGFLLSFAAVLGIGCILPVIQTEMPHKKTKRKISIIIRIKKTLIVSLSITIMQLPVLLNFFYCFSLYSVITNLFILPLVPVLLLVGLICILLQILLCMLPLLALSKLVTFFGFICHAILCFFQKVCQIILLIPNSNCILGKPDRMQIILYYSILIFLWATYQICKKRKYGVSTFPVLFRYLLIIIAFACLIPQRQEGLRIDMLDVGQGECIFIQTQENKHFLIDCGSTSKSKVGKYTLIPFLKYNGVNKIDQLFVTHLDEDHISGIIELIDCNEGIKIKQLNLPQVVIKDKKYEELMELCSMHKIKVAYLYAGDFFQDEKLSLEILHPSRDYQPIEANDYSFIIKVEYGSFHALFTGDATEKGEHIAGRELAGWKCHLYKAAHHGSRYSNTEELLQTIKPEVAIISCGKNNSYGHPHKETLQRLENIHSNMIRTDESGEITVYVNNDQYKVETYLTF